MKLRNRRPIAEIDIKEHHLVKLLTFQEFVPTDHLGEGRWAGARPGPLRVESGMTRG